jgi:hypothetical protein
MRIRHSIWRPAGESCRNSLCDDVRKLLDQPNPQELLVSVIRRA